MAAINAIQDKAKALPGRDIGVDTRTIVNAFCSD